MANWKTTGVNIGLLLAIIGSVMFVADVGIGQSYDIISADDGNVTADSYAAIGQTVNLTTAGDIGLTDRVVVGCMFLTVITGVVGVSASRKDPKAMKLILTWFPLLGMAVGLTVFTDQITDILSGNYDFTVGNDALNAMYLAVSGWTISGVLRLVNNR